MFTGRWLQGALLIQPHAVDAEHGPAGEPPRPAGAGAQLPLTCPPPVGGTRAASACSHLDSQALGVQGGSGLSPGDDSPELQAWDGPLAPTAQ